MDYSQLVAEFEARKGITRVPTGKRAYTETQMLRAEGWQPQTLTVYTIHLLGEDGKEWAETQAAEDERDAEFKIKRKYPESRVLEIKL